MTTGSQDQFDQLMAVLRSVFAERGHDTIGNIDGDPNTRTVRLRKANAGGEDWVVTSLTETQLSTGDLHGLAKALYIAAYG
jgi:hypothetical protein